MKDSAPTMFAFAVLIAGASTPALAHEDDPKLLDRRPAIKGSGFQRGLPAGALLPGGGRNPRHWNPASARPRRGAQPRVAGGGQASRSASAGTPITLEAQLTLADLGGGMSGNDCWGYTSASAREYAIIGTSSLTVFVEVTNPGTPTIVRQFASPNSMWRDMKVLGEHCYVVSEGGGGIQVFDMTAIDTGVIVERPSVTGNGVDETHNVAIDTDSGFLYRAGGAFNGLRIYSLATPDQPVFVGEWNDKYVHDVQVVTYTAGPLAGREIAYCCGGLNQGFTATGLTIVDVTNKSNPVVLSEISYPDASYSHQGWLSEDRRYFYLGDELDENFAGITDTVTRVFDVTDPTSPSFVGEFSNGLNAVSHNMYSKDGLLFQANYTTGLRVFDYASSPTSPVEIASFDTSALSGPTFNGLWSVFPYFASGTVIGSDIEGGLFVWSTDFGVGSQFCDGAVNSTGAPSTIVPSGSADIALNDLRLEAVDLPLNSFGYFVGGPGQGFVANPAGSAGNLCIANPVGRFDANIGNSGQAGVIGLDVDNTMIPTPSGFVALSPGDTLNFQLWYRDAVGGQATSNFSAGYSVTFR